MQRRHRSSSDLAPELVTRHLLRPGLAPIAGRRGRYTDRCRRERGAAARRAARQPGRASSRATCSRSRREISAAAASISSPASGGRCRISTGPMRSRARLVAAKLPARGWWPRGFSWARPLPRAAGGRAASRRASRAPHAAARRAGRRRLDDDVRRAAQVVVRPAGAEDGVEAERAGQLGQHRIEMCAGARAAVRAIRRR